METCTEANVCDHVARHDSDIQELWDEVFGSNPNNFVFTGNIGVPANDDLTNDTERYTGDVADYSKAAAIINSLQPKGLFIVGDANYDLIDQDTDDYDNWMQEQKITSGFTDLLLKKRIWPVMGDLDYWIVQDSTGTLPEKMERAYLRMFSYLPDAKRYYSMYDEQSKTEFYVLSSGRYKDYYNATTGYIYADDRDLAADQHDWLVQRTSASPAKNKVVIFHHPFVSLSDVFQGTTIAGATNVWTDFTDWDFEAMGIRLIVNGHAGNSFHLKKGAIHVVNSSSVIRSRMNLIEVEDDTEPPQIEDIYGVPGFGLEYFSRTPMGVAVPYVEYPVTPGSFIVPKTEIFELTCTPGGMTGKFISYNPNETAFEALMNSKVVEHEFEISAND